jgi:5-(carboxyamino)imidazole ribonucleotide mutase
MKPLVSIIMGSDSDLDVMKDAAITLDHFKVPYELTIVSAHRTPERMVWFAREAADRGVHVIIAGAGGSAHLPGMVASLTHLPVIGVPVESKTLSGVDSLYSIVQMPPGVPVATVAINGAANAGLLALQILALREETLSKQLIAYKEQLKSQVEDKADKLERVGWKKYTAQKKA